MRLFLLDDRTKIWGIIAAWTEQIRENLWDDNLDLPIGYRHRGAICQGPGPGFLGREIGPAKNSPPGTGGIEVTELL